MVTIYTVKGLGKSNVIDYRKEVISYLHYNGENKDKISEGQWRSSYLKADGFGQIGMMKAMQNDWDWSHVRDSSPEAFENIYQYLERNGVIGSGS